MKMGEFWIRGFVVELWRDLLTSTAVASNPESSEEQNPSQQTAYQLDSSICTTIQTATGENETAKATQLKFCLPQHNTKSKSIAPMVRMPRR